MIASPKGKQKLVENKITHILSIHDTAEPADGVSKYLHNELNQFLHYTNFLYRNMCTNVLDVQTVHPQICKLIMCN